MAKTQARSDRLRKALSALTAIVKHPADVGRYALAFDRDDGAALGWWLRRGLSPAARRGLGAAVLANDDVVFQFDGGGYTWICPTGDEIAVSLFSLGGYSTGEAIRLGHWVRAHRPDSGSIVVEVGANIGTTTLPFATEGWRVIACEPVPKTFEFLARNVAANGLDGLVACRQIAIADYQGVAAMVVPNGLGASHILTPGTARNDDVTHIDVPVTTLDALLADEGVTPPDVAFVWCDAEGAEASVISGGTALWSAGVPMYAECGVGDADALVDASRPFFAEFLSEQEIRDKGTMARPCPLQELPSFLTSLSQVDNVLLLPH